MKALLTYIQNLSSYDNTKYILSGEETCSIIYNELTTEVERRKPRKIKRI